MTSARSPTSSIKFVVMRGVRIQADLDDQLFDFSEGAWRGHCLSRPIMVMTPFRKRIHAELFDHLPSKAQIAKAYTKGP
jgi:hypothetical protein